MCRCWEGTGADLEGFLNHLYLHSVPASILMTPPTQKCFPYIFIGTSFKFTTMKITYYFVYLAWVSWEVALPHPTQEHWKASSLHHRTGSNEVRWDSSLFLSFTVEVQNWRGRAINSPTFSVHCPAVGTAPLTGPSQGYFSSSTHLTLATPTRPQPVEEEKQMRHVGSSAFEGIQWPHKEANPSPACELIFSGGGIIFLYPVLSACLIIKSAIDKLTRESNQI